MVNEMILSYDYEDEELRKDKTHACTYDIKSNQTVRGF